MKSSSEGRVRGKKKLRRLGNIERDILEELSFGDLLYAHLSSAGSTRRFYQLARQRATERYRRKQAIDRLQADGYISVRGELLQITAVGKVSVDTFTDRNRALLASKTWDHKWRIVVFDIPERLAQLRRQVRSILKRSGFVMLQQSVWVFPHECKELVQLIKSDRRVTSHILYGVLEDIEGGDRLKKLFRLR